MRGIRSTWEWQDDAQIRGFAHPAIYAALYKALQLLVGICFFFFFF